MLVVAPELSGPWYPWWTALCTLCPKRWCFPEGRPVYLLWGTDMVPAPRWRPRAFALDSGPPQQSGLAPPPPAVASVVTPPGHPHLHDGRHWVRIDAHSSWQLTGTRTPCPRAKGQKGKMKSDKKRDVQRIDPHLGGQAPHLLAAPPRGPLPSAAGTSGDYPSPHQDSA